MPTLLERAPRGCSRGVKRSTNLRRHICDDANRSFCALNALYGCEAATAAPPSEAQEAVQHRALVIAREVSHARNCICPQEAFRELLGPRCDYNGESTTVEPYDRSRLSLPPVGGKPVPLDSVLDTDSSELLRGFARSQFLTPSEREGPVPGAYLDERLRSDRSLHIEFLKDLFACGCMGASKVKRGVVTPFMVSKKGGSQRLVFDCRRVNRYFPKAPYTEIGAAASFANLEVPPGQKLYNASADVKACFYQCGIGPELADFFSLLDVAADEAYDIGLSHFNDGSPILPQDEAVTNLIVTPIGFRWAFWFVQRMHLLLVEGSGVDRSRIALGHWPLPGLAEGPIEVPYCDNVTCVGLDRDATLSTRDLVLGAFETAGFAMHKISECLDDAVVLGSDLGGLRPLSRRTLPKLWLLRRAMEFVSKGAPVIGKQVEVLNGHIVAACSYQPLGLFVLRASYRFDVDCYDLPIKAWPSVRYGYSILSALLFLLEYDLCRPWSTEITCSDACPSGFGVCQKQAPLATIKSARSWRENWRFKRLDPWEWAPRERALENDDELYDHHTACGSGDFKKDWRMHTGFPDSKGTVRRRLEDCSSETFSI